MNKKEVKNITHTQTHAHPFTERTIVCVRVCAVARASPIFISFSVYFFLTVSRCYKTRARTHTRFRNGCSLNIFVRSLLSTDHSCKHRKWTNFVWASIFIFFVFRSLLFIIIHIISFSTKPIQFLLCFFWSFSSLLFPCYSLQCLNKMLFCLVEEEEEEKEKCVSEWDERVNERRDKAHRSFIRNKYQAKVVNKMLCLGDRVR